MKKILALLLTGVAAGAVADTFQDFNNNIYAQYNLISPNQGTVGNYDNWGLGGTFQSKNNVWLNANAIAGNSTINNNSSLINQQPISDYNLSLKAGYAFQFLNGDSNGFQVIPYASFGTFNMTGVGTSSTTYSYGLGVKPEYRLLNSLKVSLDANVYGVQQGQSTFTTSGQSFNYAITPEVQYDISKTILLGVAYTYNNTFNSQGNLVGDSGNSVTTLKVGYLF